LGKKGRTYSPETIIIYSSLSFCAVLALGILSTLSEIGPGFTWLVVVGLFLSLGFPLYLFIIRGKRPGKTDIFAVGISLIFTILNGVYHHVCLWGGYDAGVYSFFTMHIADSGSFFLAPLAYPSYAGFGTVGSGQVTAQFLPGYSYYLSPFYKLGGMNGLFVGNSLLLFFTLLIMYFLAKRIGSSKAGIIFISLFAVHYTTLWFSRRTLSECLVVPLIWLAFLLFIRGVEERNGNFIIASFVPLSLGLLVRVETLLYVFGFVFIAFFLWLINLRYWKAKISISKASIIGLFLIALNTFNLVYYLHLSDARYYSKYLKDIWLKFSGLFSRIAPLPVAQTGPNNWNDYVFRYVFDSFNAYLLIALLLFAFIAFRYRKYNLKMLLLVLLASPSLVLIRYPTISWVHPWFMRHYWVVLVPLIIFAASIGIDAIKNRKYKMIIIFLVLTTFLASWIPLVTFAEEKDLPATLERIHEELGDTDAPVIVALGSHYISDPLHFMYGYNTISSNYDNLDNERVLEGLEGEEEIYIISSGWDTGPGFPYEILPNFMIYPDEELEFVATIEWHREVLERITEADRYVLPDRIPAQQTFKGYQPIKASMGSLPPTSIKSSDVLLNIYRVKVRADPDI